MDIDDTYFPANAIFSRDVIASQVPMAGCAKVGDWNRPIEVCVSNLFTNRSRIISSDDNCIVEPRLVNFNLVENFGSLEIIMNIKFSAILLHRLITVGAVFVSTILTSCGGGSSVGEGSKLTQDIIFGVPLPLIVGGSVKIQATGGASGNIVTFKNTTPGTCSISNNMVTGLALGVCAIVANQEGDDKYFAASQVMRSFDVVVGSQTFSGMCRVELGAAIGYVTNVSNAKDCVNTKINVDGYGATVSILINMPRVGFPVVAFDLLPLCEPMGMPPSPGAEIRIPCKK